jgi:hypothetical protein
LIGTRPRLSMDRDGSFNKSRRPGVEDRHPSMFGTKTT